MDGSRAAPSSLIRRGIITAGHQNRTAHTVASAGATPSTRAALIATFEHIVANNRAGGWCKLKRER
jgi:hypothetical protein